MEQDRTLTHTHTHLPAPEIEVYGIMKLLEVGQLPEIVGGGLWPVEDLTQLRESQLLALTARSGKLRRGRLPVGL